MFTHSTTFCERVSARIPRSSADYAEAIAAFFFDLPRWLDIRPLWRRGATSFWRVNFWRTDMATGQEQIGRSAFVAIEENSRILKVKELS